MIIALGFIVAMALTYSGGIWLLLDPRSPFSRRRARRSIDREVARLTADLDRKLADLMPGR